MSQPDEVTPLDQAPCGCRFGQVDDAFIFEPCAMDCELLIYVQTQAAKANKPLRTIDMR